MTRRIRSPELIGRAAETAALRAALADVRCGHGRLVLVEGDAGIGKTRLLEEFTTQAKEVRVLAGGGIPLASGTPYAPVLNILQSLARLHPSAAAGLMLQDAPGHADPFGRTRLLAATADAVRAVAAKTPLMLVVEDLHWADASTRELVSFLARVNRTSPVLLVVTVRAEELDPARPVSVLIGELARMPQAERLVLVPLDPAGVAALVEAITGVAASAGVTGRLMQRAAGNPFFTEELLAAGPDAPMVPASVGDVLAVRVAQLSAAGQRVLGAASALGRAVPHQLLAAVAEASDLGDGLAAAVSHRLLEPRDDGYRFRHPLIQETVYGRLLLPERQVLHGRAAAALASAGSPAEPAARAGHAVQIAFHWQQAGQTDKALAAAVRAGDLRRLRTPPPRRSPSTPSPSVGGRTCRTRSRSPASTRSPCWSAPPRPRPRPAITPARRSWRSGSSPAPTQKRSLSKPRCGWSGWAGSAGSPGTWPRRGRPTRMRCGPCRTSNRRPAPGYWPRPRRA